MRLSAATIDAAFPFVAQARKLVSEPELRGLVAVLRPTTRDLSGLVDATTTLLPQVDRVNRCVINNVLPTIKTTVQDGDLTTGVPVYKELSQGLVPAAGEGQNFDGNGQYVRLASSGGPLTGLEPPVDLRRQAALREHEREASGNAADLPGQEAPLPSRRPLRVPEAA